MPFGMWHRQGGARVSVSRGFTRSLARLPTPTHSIGVAPNPVIPHHSPRLSTPTAVGLRGVPTPGLAPVCPVLVLAAWYAGHSACRREGQLFIPSVR
eukprot:COSAG01_NODE_904_length_12843_cov_83.351146_3_plen_97_part_00